LTYLVNVAKKLNAKAPMRNRSGVHAIVITAAFLALVAEFFLHKIVSSKRNIYWLMKERFDMLN
jgi:hypothetical protein